MLYREDTAKPIGHYVGSLIPEFKDKNGNYMALNIVFNQDENVHNMIMSFNTDLLYEPTDDSQNNIGGGNTDAIGKSMAPMRSATTGDTKTVSAFDIIDLRVPKLEPGIPTKITPEQAEKINATLEGAVKDTLTAEQAAIYNSGLKGAIKANVETTFTAEQLAKYNEAIKGLGDSIPAEHVAKAQTASEAGTRETTTVTPNEAQAAAYNATLTGAKKTGDKLDKTQAAAYNAALTGAIRSGDNVEPTEAQANAYNNIVLPEEIEKKMPKPVYLKGYTYKTSAVTNLQEKISWHKSILETLTEYKGLRRALLNKSNIDFRYIVDTFEAYPESGTADQDTTKSMLSYLAKQKESALAILNFPSVRNFVKYGETYLTNNIFDINKVVKLYRLPNNSEGASFCAFYTPLKFTDGYIDTIVPSAGLVSNLFMQKYASRQPYYIIAGPNYGLISSNGLVGPDYNYSNDELQIIEPFGVNCMIYRPGFGTFINANQTAKQTPVSALSKVHVRELVIYLQDEIEKVLQSYQWEFNNTTTRNAILDKANQICARVAANGGIQAYLNVMDESNNTPDVIDNEMAILSTHIEPGRGCGKMIQELTIYRTGELSSTITE